MRHQWDHGNFEIIGQIVSEVVKMRRFLGPRMRNTSPEKMERVKKIITKARQEIESILEEQER